MGGEAGRYEQQNSRFRAARSRGRRVLSIANNHEDCSQLQCGEITVTTYRSTAAEAAEAAAAATAENGRTE